MKRSSIAAVAILAAASATSPVQATLTFFDPFNYQVPDGTSLSGQTDTSITPNRQWFMAATATTSVIVAPGSSPVVLLPLADGYLLFTSETGAATAQILDSHGNPIGTPRPIPSMPVIARELADGPT